MALNTARISEGLLSLRFPRTRLFAASAPVCIQVLNPCLTTTSFWLVRISRCCVGCCQIANRAVHAAVCCKCTGLRPGVVSMPTGRPCTHHLPWSVLTVGVFAELGDWHAGAAVWCRSGGAGGAAGRAECGAAAHDGPPSEAAGAQRACAAGTALPCRAPDQQPPTNRAYMCSRSFGPAAAFGLCSKHSFATLYHWMRLPTHKRCNGQ